VCGCGWGGWGGVGAWHARAQRPQRWRRGLPGVGGEAGAGRGSRCRCWRWVVPLPRARLQPGMGCGGRRGRGCSLESRWAESHRCSGVIAAARGPSPAPPARLLNSRALEAPARLAARRQAVVCAMCMFSGRRFQGRRRPRFGTWSSGLTADQRPVLLLFARSVSSRRRLCNCTTALHSPHSPSPSPSLWGCNSRGRTHVQQPGTQRERVSTISAAERSGVRKQLCTYDTARPGQQRTRLVWSTAPHMLRVADEQGGDRARRSGDFIVFNLITAIFSAAAATAGTPTEEQHAALSAR
jgi:hypothetical protein